MEKAQEKIEKLIQGSLREGEAKLETLPNGHICGHIISSEFDGLSHKERRLRVRGILAQGLEPEELLNVGTLLTYTPAEWAWDLQES